MPESQEWSVTYIDQLYPTAPAKSTLEDVQDVQGTSQKMYKINNCFQEPDR